MEDHKQESPSSGPVVNRKCLVTTGATAPFPELICAALQSGNLRWLAENGYTHVNFQVGTSMQYYTDLREQMTTTEGLKLCAFAFHPDLKDDMRDCLDGEGQVRGCCISAAGSGTILDALRVDLPLIVVPNLSLLDNHQQELANEMHRQGYVTKSTTNGLAKALRRCHEISANRTIEYRKRIAEYQAAFTKRVNNVVGYIDDSYDVNAREG
ncbi:hypothetical protein BJ878DRAFT_544005 [Calycina marina]|uniref:UDP-N-acetylglucosamine transferase subunit ALG13 n=1 Tax=Calycina marina TaxID=1763456 RepID=A0A9P8CD58_9HELO|nr:hypothetical protein BJ878DRAFT_544005 [Calycina marina]